MAKFKALRHSWDYVGDQDSEESEDYVKYGMDTDSTEIIPDDDVLSKIKKMSMNKL